jgi:hypothetical protein
MSLLKRGNKRSKDYWSLRGKKKNRTNGGIGSIAPPSLRTGENFGQLRPNLHFKKWSIALFTPPQALPQGKWDPHRGGGEGRKRTYSLDGQGEMFVFFGYIHVDILYICSFSHIIARVRNHFTVLVHIRLTAKQKAPQIDRILHVIVL